jgi:hypothetical protein
LQSYLCSIGFKWFEVRRRPMMVLATFFSFCSLLLLIPPPMALSLNHEIVTHTSWTYGTVMLL